MPRAQALRAPRVEAELTVFDGGRVHVSLCVLDGGQRKVDPHPNPRDVPGQGPLERAACSTERERCATSPSSSSSDACVKSDGSVDSTMSFGAELELVRDIEGYIAKACRGRGLPPLLSEMEEDVCPPPQYHKPLLQFLEHWSTRFEVFESLSIVGVAKRVRLIKTQEETEEDDVLRALRLLADRHGLEEPERWPTTKEQAKAQLRSVQLCCSP